MPETAKTLESIASDLAEVKTALLGQPEYNQPGWINKVEGLVTKVEGHATDIKEIKEKNFKMTVYISALITTLTLVGGKIAAKLAIIFAAIPK